MPIIKKIFDSQLEVTSNHINDFLTYQSILFSQNERVISLINKYRFEKTTNYGCVQKFAYQNKDYSCLYMEMANRIDHIRKFIDIENINTYFEIGGGFGANLHFLLTNFKNIKKIIYLDAVPNIYVGTEYLRSLFGKSVIDYMQIKKMKEIKFSNNNDLEIYCIPPWQIENLNIEIDHFHNAASFVEMPFHVIENYAKFLYKNKVKSVSLVTYDRYDAKTTFDPKKLNDFFNNELKIYEYPIIITQLNRKNIYLIKN